jgi:hypothetical protein
MNNKQRLIEHLRYRIIEKLNESKHKGSPILQTITLSSGGYVHPMVLYPSDERYGEQVDSITRHLGNLNELGALHEIIIHPKDPNNGNREIIRGKKLKDYIHPDFVRGALSGEEDVSLVVRHGAVTPPAENIPEPVKPEEVKYNRDPQVTDDDDHHGAIVDLALDALHPNIEVNTQWEKYAASVTRQWNMRHGA